MVRLKQANGKEKYTRMETKNELSKIKDETVDEVTSALIAFFDRKGGHTPVANKIGVNPQQLYYIITGRNAPTLKTVMRILRYYPNEVELRKALSLSTEENYGTTDFSEAPQTDEANYWRDRYREVEGKLAGLESKYDAIMSSYQKLMDKYESLMEKTIRKLDPSFNPATDETPAPKARRTRRHNLNCRTAKHTPMLAPGFRLSYMDRGDRGAAVA